MGVSKVHYCYSQEYISQGIEEPPAAKCRCRKQISLSDATKMVKNGEARWVVTSRTKSPGTKPCSLCHGDPEIKNCANCHGVGTQPCTDVVEEYANDIVLVSRASVDAPEKKYRPALAMKTPRVATIEEEHIELAYIEGLPEAEARIEEYGRLILEARMWVGPKANGIPAIIPEPEDNPDTGEGRNEDWGRAPFSKLGDGDNDGRPSVGKRIATGMKIEGNFE